MRYKAQRVLEFIGSRGSEGASLKEIQTFIMRMNGLIGENEQRPHSSRGYWCDYLFNATDTCMGSPMGGLLYAYCARHPHTGKWVLTEPIPSDHFRDNKTKTLAHNRALRRGYQALRDDSMPRCENCGRALYYYAADKRNGRSPWTPDHEACVSSTGHAYNTDCKGRVFTRDWQLTNIKNSEVAILERTVRELYDNGRPWEEFDLALRRLIEKRVVSR